MAKNTKTKTIKREKGFQTDGEQEVKQFIKILIILIILVVGVYLFTRIFVTKDLLNDSDTESEVTAGEISYTVATIGTMLNRPIDEYLVILYDVDDINAVYYSGLVSAYSSSDDALSVYTVDLGSELNKNYVTSNEDEINITNDLTQFKVGSLALLKIENGKIADAYTTEEEIVEALS